MTEIDVMLTKKKSYFATHSYFTNESYFFKLSANVDIFFNQPKLVIPYLKGFTKTDVQN